jgi:sigma-B regulation protein RsbU (phosphoserine phosphatase)
MWLLGLAGICVAETTLKQQMRRRVQAERELREGEARLQVLAEHNARLDAEQKLLATREKLHLAAALQKRLLPQDWPELPGYEFAAVIYPCDETAGDFYDFLVMSDGSLAVVVGDVSGHGYDAALLMSATIGHLRALATYCRDVRQILTRLNKLIADEADGHFVTLFVAQLESAAGTLCYAGAGHPGYWVKRSGDVEVLETDCPPLGIVPDLHLQSPRRISLECGQTILLYTDGLSEAMNSNDELYGSKRISDCVQSHSECDAKTIVETLRDDVRRFTAGVEPNDDITVVAIQKTEVGTH